MLLLFLPLFNTFMLSCSCWFSNDACYIPWFYQLRVFYAKCFVRNDEIKLWNQIKSVKFTSILLSHNDEQIINVGTANCFELKCNKLFTLNMFESGYSLIWDYNTKAKHKIYSLEFYSETPEASRLQNHDKWNMSIKMISIDQIFIFAIWLFLTIGN